MLIVWEEEKITQFSYFFKPSQRRCHNKNRFGFIIQMNDSIKLFIEYIIVITSHQPDTSSYL